MIRENLDFFKHQVCVILSFGRPDLMHDEVIAISQLNPPFITCLHKLAAAMGRRFSYKEKVDWKAHYRMYEPGAKIADPRWKILARILLIEMERHDRIDVPTMTINDTNDKSDIIDNAAGNLLEESSTSQQIEPNSTFISHLTQDMLRDLAEKLIEAKFISDESADNFVYAFGKLPIEKGRKVKWIQYRKNEGNDNVALCMVIRHLAPEESNKGYKTVVAKMKELFELPFGFPKDLRSMEASLRIVRYNRQVLSDKHEELVQILES